VLILDAAARLRDRTVNAAAADQLSTSFRRDPPLAFNRWFGIVTCLE